MYQEDIEKVYRQMISLERAVRHSRLTIGTLMDDYMSSGPDFGFRPMPSGLGDLLASRANLADKQVSPHETIAPGVRCAFPAAHRGNSVSVTQFCFDAVPGESSLAATIGIDVNLDRKNPLPWLNVESDLDVDRLRSAKALSISLAVSFRTAPNSDLGRYGLALRGFAGGGHHDYSLRRFPAFEVPIEMTYEIPPAEYAHIPWNDFERVALVIDLPAGRQMNYRFYLSHFEVESRDS